MEQRWSDTGEKSVWPSSRSGTQITSMRHHRKIERHLFKCERYQVLDLLDQLISQVSYRRVLRGSEVAVLERKHLLGKERHHGREMSLLEVC